jgi:hypothetical protein
MPTLSPIGGTEIFAKEAPYTHNDLMKTALIGYARYSTDKQDLSAQKQALLERNHAIGTACLSLEFCSKTRV